MAAPAEDPRGVPAAGGFRADNPAGVGVSLMIAAGLLIANLLLQMSFGLAAQAALYGPVSHGDEAIRGRLVGMFPAALLTAVIAWQAAKLRGGDPRAVLNLKAPGFGVLGWIAVVLGFLVGIVVLFGMVVSVFRLFGMEEPPGGLVEKTMAGLASDPRVYLLVMPSVVLGAPLAEEMIFRGQVFTALAQTRLGFAGASILTAAAWSLLHYSGNWLLVTLIFVMGLVFGWMLYRFASLWVTMACHAVWNASTSLIIFGVLPQ